MICHRDRFLKSFGLIIYSHVDRRDLHYPSIPPGWGCTNGSPYTSLVRRHQYRCILALARPRQLCVSQWTYFQCLNRDLEIVNRAGRRCKMKDIVEVAGDVNEFWNIMMIKFELLQLRRDVQCSGGSPVIRLSIAITWKPSLINLSDKCDPRKPAAPGY